MVIVVTAFIGGVAGVFLLSGAGVPGLRVLVSFLFFVCLLNLSLYLKEFGQWCHKSIQAAGSALAGQKPAEAKPAGGGGSGGQGGGGGGQGGGTPAGGH
jgi:hypothetical protein